jgi:choline dehydrogenase-like flavoprotein
MSFTVTERQRRALEEICETFCPNGDGAPSARSLGVADAVIEAVGMNPREAEKSQLALLLTLWDTPALGAVGGAGWGRFSSLQQAAREQLLLSWANSRIPQQRAVYQALRKAALMFYYMLPGPGGSRNPAWDAIGYDGPLGKLEGAPPKALKVSPIERDTALECDVVIVGSGAGGGAAAGVLSASGLDVIVIEAGGYHDDEDFDGAELPAITGRYMAAPNATHDQSVGLAAGWGLGGGTVVNYSTSFKTPDEIRAEWASHGVSAFLSEEYTASLEAVWDRLGVNQEHNDPSTRDQKLQEGCVKLGWHVDAMPRSVRQCAQGKECGYCGLGCRVGAKQSVVKTWLADAHAKGSRLIVDCRVQRVLIEGGAARGVVGITGRGHHLTVRARTVIAASGAIHTPALLKRSGLQNQHIGRNLKLHPVAVVWGIFDEQLKPWEGVMQSLYSDEFRNLDGGYGVKLETGPMHPHLVLPFLPWRNAGEHFELMQALPNLTGVAALVRDRDGGEVRVGRDGEPIVRYKLSDYDAKHLRTGLDGCASILEAAGAQRIIGSHVKWVGYEPGRSGSREQFMADADAAGYSAGQITLGSFHIMGSARMGGSPASSACDPAGQTWDVRDLYVCDGSAFPTASGVNPQISIQAIANMSARGIAARLA